MRDLFCTRSGDRESLCGNKPFVLVRARDNGSGFSHFFMTSNLFRTNPNFHMAVPFTDRCFTTAVVPGDPISYSVITDEPVLTDTASFAQIRVPAVEVRKQL